MHNEYDLTSGTQLINQNAEGYNPCFNMIIQDKKGKESNILRKGYLKDNMSKIRPLNTSLLPDNANVCFMNTTQKNGIDKGTI